MTWRVRDRATFGALRRSGRRARRGPLTVSWVAADPATPPRVAYAIGRSVGNAVTRNRLRRRLRAAAAEVAADVPGGAYLVRAAPEATDLPFAELRAHLEAAMAAAARGAAR